MELHNSNVKKLHGIRSVARSNVAIMISGVTTFFFFAGFLLSWSHFINARAHDDIIIVVVEEEEHATVNILKQARGFVLYL